MLVYNGQEIEQRDDSYVNLTQLAKASCKRLDNYLANKSTKEYLQELANSLEFQEDTLILTQEGVLGGTYAHPLVAIHFGQWVSPAFHVWCNQHIKTLMETGKTELATTIDFSDPLVTAQLYIEAETERRALAAQIEADKPKVEFFEAVANSDNLMTLGDFIKTLDIGRNTGFKILRELGIIQKDRSLPYQRFTSQGYFEIKIKTVETKNSVKQFPVALVTPVGEQWLVKQFKKYDQKEAITVQLEKQVALV